MRVRVLVCLCVWLCVGGVLTDGRVGGWVGGEARGTALIQCAPSRKRQRSQQAVHSTASHSSRPPTPTSPNTQHHEQDHQTKHQHHPTHLVLSVQQLPRLDVAAQRVQHGGVQPVGLPAQTVQVPVEGVWGREEGGEFDAE